MADVGSESHLDIKLIKHTLEYIHETGRLEGQDRKKHWVEEQIETDKARKEPIT
jgi:hypothetical protein